MAVSSEPPHNGWLMHFGILGQRWGVRRFQNEDGTLTEEGKERYRSTAVKKAEEYKAQADRAKADLKDFKENGFKSKRLFDDDELEDALRAEGTLEKYKKIYIRDLSDAIKEYETQSKAYKAQYEYIMKHPMATLDQIDDAYSTYLKDHPTDRYKNG